ncbi:hypothetical protein [Amycolatopsis circi]|uniref:hypothetical protein n=1 Tax=Amycolatopsis circi TaxID=871959 RepID=UPI0013BEA01B|nr:hypothetical protein [Amycolatopsis circi]
MSEKSEPGPLGLGVEPGYAHRYARDEFVERVVHGRTQQRHRILGSAAPRRC